MPLRIVRRDITQMKVDAIVNTTNEEMVGYSGVDLAVHTAAGPKLDKACAKIAPLGLGSAKITKGYNLDAKYVIHTSGPVWQGGFAGESIILKSCYVESLKLAVEHGCETVAFPLISSGAYGYPKDKVLKFAIQVISEFLLEHELTVFICVHDRASYEFSREIFAEITEMLNDDCSEAIQRHCEPEYDYCERGTAPKPNTPAHFRTSHRSSVFNEAMPAPCASMPAPQKTECGRVRNQSLEEYMKSMDKPFAYKLFDLIDKKGLTDVECYKKANVDKKTFSKIKCNPDKYKPSKHTAVAFAIALELTLDETQDLLACAGMTLSKSFTFDKIIRYFLQKGVYDIFEINEALFEFDQELLGC